VSFINKILIISLVFGILLQDTNVIFMISLQDNIHMVKRQTNKQIV